MRRLLLAFAALISLLNPVFAGPDILRETTPGGIAIRRVHLPEAPSQSLQLMWRDATALTKPGLEALASFAPAMMHEAPKGEKRGEINELLRDLQGSFRFWTSSGLSSLSVTAPPETFAETLAVAKRHLDDPGMPERRLETLRRERIAQTRTALDGADTIASQIRLRMLVEPGPHRDYLSVDPAQFSRVSLVDIEAWRRAVLARDNLVVATAGPMEAGAIAAAIDSLVAGMPAKSDVALAPKLAFRTPSKRIVFEKDVPQTIVLAFGPTGVRPGLDRVKAEFAIGRLGGGAQGRLFRALREKLGATYGVSASLDQLSLVDRALVIRSSVSHDKAAAVLDELAAEYRRWWQEGVTEAEMTAMRTQQRSNWTESLKQPGNVASALAINQILGLEETFDGVAAAREATTRDEVNAFIKERFPAWPLGLVIIAPKADGLGADCVIRALSELDRCGL